MCSYNKLAYSALDVILTWHINYMYLQILYLH